MRTVLLASLRTHTRRYVAAVLAVVIGVAFIIVTGALASATRNGLVSGVELPYRHADVVASAMSGDQAVEVMEHARREGDTAAVLGWSTQTVTSGGRLVTDRMDVAPFADAERLRWQELREGRWPRGAHEALADHNTAKVGDLAVGDVVRIGSGARAVEARIVGLADTPSASVGAGLYLPWETIRPWASSLWVDSVAYAGSGSVAEQVGMLAELTGAEVAPRDEFVEQRQASLNRDVDLIAILLLVFASVAVFVSVLVIANTFTILFAQRSRDFALLRCVGATRRQLIRSVRAESAVLAVVSSLLGLAVGTAVGYGLVALAAKQLPPGTMGAVELSTAWYASGAAVGLLVTVVAAWLPTRRVARISPLAALRPEDPAGLGTRAGRLRTACGGGLVVLGAALLAGAISQHSPQLMVAGGMAAFTGVLLLGPLLVPALISLTGGAAGRLGGAPARLATGNAVRNPRRTAATTASLLIGVTLTTAVLTGLASSRSAVSSDLDASHPIDAALTSVEAALPASLLAEVRATDGVVDAVLLDGVDAEVSEGIGELQVVAATPAAADVVRGAARVATPGPGEVFLPGDALDGEVPGRVEIRVGERTRTLSVSNGDAWGAVAVVAPATLAALSDTAGPRAVWVRAEDGADAEDLTGDLTALASGAGAEVTSGFGERAWVHLQLDVLTGAVVALLGIAVLIALVGIGNTLGLSVLERGRENALLRALGLTRRQLRRMLATESLLLSGVATVLGTLIGVVFAWVAVRTLLDTAVDEVSLVLPWGQLGAVVAIAGLAGLAAGVLPARRAARVAPAAGLALD